MNKKLLAVAVASALALPGVALAQSSVTISGNLKMSFGNHKISNPAAARVGNTSETRMTDDSSRIVFNVREDLGSGLAAIGQFDWRIGVDSGADVANGNNHVGLQSKSWGRIFMGRQDLHYFNTSSDLLVFADLKAASWNLISFVANGAPVANTSRTPNVVHYTTPNWGGFSAILAYSTSPTGAVEGDLGTATRKGSGWNFQPVLQGSNYQIGWSHWDAKPDGTLANQRSDRLFGYYAWGGLKVGLAWDKSRIKNAAGTADAFNRTAWLIPIKYGWGPHNLFLDYSRAGDDKVVGGNSGAKMLSLAYAYSLSKRTSVALTYSKISNETNAAYHLFNEVNPQIGVGAGATIAAGEDPRLMSVTVKHAF